MEQRLEASKKQVRVAEAAKVIYRSTMRWYNKIKQKKDFLTALLEAQRKEREGIQARLHEDDDDLASYASSLESKSVQSLK